MFVAKITAPVVNVGQQLFTPYGRGLIIPKHAPRQSCPPSLLHMIVLDVEKIVQQPTVITRSDTSDTELVPHTAPVMPKHYGYSTDSLREITMWIEGAREIRRNHMSHIRSLAISEEEAATYLLAIPEKIFTLQSTDILSSITIGDGSCGFRALRQRPRARISQFTSGTPCQFEMWTMMTS